jgi:hypothetical protein
MPYTWEFIEGRDSPRHTWHWRRLRGDGTQEKLSEAFDDYGLVIKDAVTNGFKPSRQPWVVITPRSITHFTSGHQPITEPRVPGIPPEPPQFHSVRK